MSRGGRRRTQPVTLPALGAQRADDDGPYARIVGQGETVPDINGDVGGTVRRRHPRDILCDGDADMLAAWDQFSADFSAAHLNGLAASSLEWLPSGAGSLYLDDHVVAARQRVSAALMALGGYHTAGSNVVWHVVGLDESVKDYSEAFGLDRKRQAGALECALMVMAAHYRGG